jgi:hypothetical protein
VDIMVSFWLVEVMFEEACLFSFLAGAALLFEDLSFAPWFLEDFAVSSVGLQN